MSARGVTGWGAPVAPVHIPAPGVSLPLPVLDVPASVANTDGLEAALADKADKEFVRSEVAALVGQAPETLDTLSELGNALGNDPNFATTVMAQIGGKAPIVHFHGIGDITGLQAALDAKQPVGNYQPAGSYAAAVHQHTYLSVPDTRATVDTPQDKLNKALAVDFKSSAAVGSPPVSASSTFSHILTMAGWNTYEGSGGWASQVSFGDGLAIRQATSAVAWGPWRKVWTDRDFDPAYKVSYSDGADIRVAGQVRATGWYRGQRGNGEGLGVEMGVSGARGYIYAYDRQASAFGPLTIGGTSVQIGAPLEVTAGITAGPDGFKQAAYTVGARNPIWRFGNADGYGLSYFQGSSGIGGNDTIGFHFGVPTAAGSILQINMTGTNVTVNGDIKTTGNLLVNGTTSQPVRPNRLYRRDASDNYSVQTHWTGQYWYLQGYYEDTYHAGTLVDWAYGASNVGNVITANGQSSTARIQNTSGYVDIGPMNSAWSHFQTDRPSFYFNKPVAVDGTISRYQQGAFLHHASGSYGSGRIFTSATQPAGMVAGDIWLQPV